MLSEKQIEKLGKKLLTENKGLDDCIDELDFPYNDIDTVIEQLNDYGVEQCNDCKRWLDSNLIMDNSCADCIVKVTK